MGKIEHNKAIWSHYLAQDWYIRLLLTTKLTFNIFDQFEIRLISLSRKVSLYFNLFFF